MTGHEAHTAPGTPDRPQPAPTPAGGCPGTPAGKWRDQEGVVSDCLRDPHYCRLCRTYHPVKSITDMHNAKVDQEDDR